MMQDDEKVFALRKDFEDLHWEFYHTLIALRAAKGEDAKLLWSLVDILIEHGPDLRNPKGNLGTAVPFDDDAKEMLWGLVDAAQQFVMPQWYGSLQED